MTKQEIIQKAYGEHWEKVKDHVNENGWCTMFDENNYLATPPFIDLGFSLDFIDNQLDSGYNSEKKTFEWRPKSLEPIDHNNGWVKIESEADLPKVSGSVWFVLKDGPDFSGIYASDFKAFKSHNTIVFRASEVSHYQSVIKPKLPIY